MFRYDLRRTVARSIVHDDDFESSMRLRSNAQERLVDCGFSVMCRNYDGDEPSAVRRHQSMFNAARNVPMLQLPLTVMRGSASGAPVSLANPCSVENPRP